MKAQSLRQAMLQAARQQTLYRAVNERMYHLNAAFAELASLSGTWVCECADPGCTEMMQLTLPEYEALRAHPNRFAVLRGHASARAEQIVEEHDHWVVVEKLGAAADFATAHNPRAPLQAA